MIFFFAQTSAINLVKEMQIMLTSNSECVCIMGISPVVYTFNYNASCELTENRHDRPAFDRFFIEIPTKMFF